MSERRTARTRASWRGGAVLLALAAGALLGESCWDPILDLRACGSIQMNVPVDAVDVAIPNCFHSGDIQTIRTRETWSTLGLPTSLVISEQPRDRYTSTLHLASTAMAVVGNVELFTLDFVAVSPQLPDFTQTILIEVTFTAPTGTPACTPGPAIQAADACTALRAATASWVTRCNPELAADSARLSETVCDGVDPFTDAQVVYDAAAARGCACEIETMDCNAGDPFRFLANCAATAVGVIASGDACDPALPHQCASGHCINAPNACGGTCEDPVADGGACERSDNAVLPCTAGSWCAPGGICEALPGPGEDCNTFQLCSGDFDSFVLIGPTCEPATGTCERRGFQGDSCVATLTCQPTHECGATTGSCELKPTTGEACTLPIDVADPSSSDWNTIIGAAIRACRDDALTLGGGDYCTQNGPTSGSGVCTPVPQIGEVCGLADGLAARCAAGSYCDGIDAANLLTGDMGVCTATLGEGQACDGQWDIALLGPQCGQPGAVCQRQSASLSVCACFD